MTDREKVAKGFPIDRSAEDTLTLYNQLVDEDGPIKTNDGDFVSCQGLTQKPLTTSDETNITVTHLYIKRNRTLS